MLEKAPRYHGAFSHFINGATGQTVPFSRIDDGGDLVETTLLVQGMICAREFFCGHDPVETAICERMDNIINQIEWDWYTKGGKATLFWHWSPKHGWRKNLPVSGWNEALMCYVLALGAGTHTIDASLYHSSWARFGHFRNGTCQSAPKRAPLSASKKGSDAISMTSGRSDNACLEQIELSATVHLPFDELELCDLALCLAVRPL